MIDSIEQYQKQQPDVINGVPMPAVCAVLVRRELVVANNYNPNHVPTEKMNLLVRSIQENGFCFPIVTILDSESGHFVIVDGFHRRRVADPEFLDLPYVPIVVLEHGVSQRMAATIQFNKARGVHQVDLDAEVIRALIQQGLSEPEIAAKLGIDEDTVHRYKQLTGVAELFKNSAYSPSWEVQ